MLILVLSAFFWYLSWARRVRVAPGTAVTDRHTHTHYEYCNLAPAWARLINYQIPRGGKQFARGGQMPPPKINPDHVNGPGALWHIDGNHKLIRLVNYYIPPTFFVVQFMSVHTIIIGRYSVGDFCVVTVYVYNYQRVR